jgi:hypothetical protein
MPGFAGQGMAPLPWGLQWTEPSAMALPGHVGLLTLLASGPAGIVLQRPGWNHLIDTAVGGLLDQSNTVFVGY